MASFEIFALGVETDGVAGGDVDEWGGPTVWRWLRRGDPGGRRGVGRRRAGSRMQCEPLVRRWPWNLLPAG